MDPRPRRAKDLKPARVLTPRLARGYPAPVRGAAAVVIANLLLFLALTTSPAFQAAHHHWIFPILAASVAAQWAATFALKTPSARSPLLSVLLFLLCIGIARHATILTCFDRCAFKLAAAAGLAAPVFLLQSRLGAAGWWTPLRANLVAFGAAAWAVYLTTRGYHLASWAIDMSFAALALVFWLGRHRADFLLLAVGIATGIFIREISSEVVRICLGVVWSVILPLASVERLQAWLDTRPKTPRPPPPRILKIVVTLGILAIVGFFVTGPVFLMTDRAQRQVLLSKMAPPVPVQDPKTLSPLAAKLRAHVVMLAETIGERDAYQPAKQAKARDYIAAQFAAAGYKPKKLAYGSLWLAQIKNGTQFHNVEAVLPVAPADKNGAWIVGAHYDSAPGTPGADDNASGVAVLIEAARILKTRKPDRDIRFVAFGTEEPPSFGTQNMGSVHYAKLMKENGVKVHAMLSLEMLGFYNDKPRSQLYPPFMHLFYPGRANYVGLVSNVQSRYLLPPFAAAWKAASPFPLQRSILPGVFSGLAMSDQLSFWDQGFPAVMLSDTAFYRNPHYHEHTDTPDTLDYERMAEVTEALVEALDPR